MSNVQFLKIYDSILVELFSRAEEYVHSDPNTALFKIRQFAEILAKYTAAQVGVPEWQQDKQVDLLNLFRNRGIYGQQALDLFHSIRKTGNKAAHTVHGSSSDALSHLKMAHHLAIIFHRTFSTDKTFTAEYKTPQPTAKVAVDILKAEKDRATDLEKEIKALHEKLRIIEANNEAQSATQKAAILSLKKASDDLQLDEKETRLLIDEQLRDAGWEVDTASLRYSKGTRPQKNKNIAIAEWPTENGNADYALFCGLKFVGVVEAKKKAKDVKSDLSQSERYSKGIKTSDEFELLGQWEKYSVPFLYSTNGRPYIEQLKEKSGIWFLDARLNANLPRPLVAWPSPEGLLSLSQKDESKAIQKLKDESTDYLPLRDYQKNAITKVEDTIAKGKREILVAMATGTGKTRTCIGLTYRLIKSERFNRILFLVDRTSLGGQAEDSFKEMKIENNKTFSDIYDIKGLDEIKPDTATKVHFATVQALIKRILYPSVEEPMIPIDQYDCIVIDECHRGYTLDKQLSGEEFQYRNEEDYISKYRRVVEYFDAVKIGLTATPALHTTEIFGKPVFTYSYREAVIDGYLVDHQEPYKIKTKLSEEGMKWKKNEDIKVYDPTTSKIQLEQTPDELALEVEDFNTNVITENFNKTVCEELVNHIEWDSNEKTLIFCARDDHADMVVRLLNDAFKAKYGDIDRNAITKITASVDKPLEKIRLFKNENFPSIVTTVDLLTTGIDVPEICNIVFLRQVKSRILYDQMIGRATRLCEKIQKDFFKIYDAVGLYDALQPYSAMKPVTPNPSITLEELAKELKNNKKSEVKDHIIEQIVAKLNARKRRIKGEAEAEFRQLTGGLDPEEYVEKMKTRSLTQQDWDLRFEQLAKWLDKLQQDKKKMIISEHDDQLIGVEQGFGETGRPEDYIEGFSKFIKDNVNKVQALIIIATRPRDLTKAELRELKLILDNQGYKEATLEKAYKEKLKSTREIAASLIGFVRREAIGDALIPFQERLDKAIVVIKSTHNFTPVQIKWIDRIKQQLEKEYVVDLESLDKGAFKIDGGLARANKIFDGKIEDILHEINELIWQQTV
ncbi:type I restriction-modification system endonuclease [Bdellovibrio reynosensis]|uniref:Type I restriction-modification system endonuclease n=1 Tax=Bdellovibrio reynosensis TaxID=2835041 RepID=A0ABY4C991_9BACT|nr:type I restriction-modification system endonuclease [Bdellovibrio reynosensis]UOF01497.1 type I restriction-modification system endonuclease [Bdellovibrio reynosensis]